MNQAIMSSGKCKITKKAFFISLIILFVLSAFSACSDKTPSDKNSSNVVVENFTSLYEYNVQCVNNEEEFCIMDGLLYGRGYNNNLFFGSNPDEFHDSYVRIAENVIHVESVYGTVLYLTNNGEVYGLGDPYNPVLLTDYNVDNRKITEPRLLFEDCKYFSLGSNFVLAIKNDNSLWFWGESKAGQGCKISEYMLEPYKIADKVKFAKAFLYNSAWIDDNNALYIVGTNAFNQIGNGNNGRGVTAIYDDVVIEPYLALPDCSSFSVSEDFVIRAVTNGGIEYIWGNHHKSAPTKITDAFPEQAKDFELTNSKVIASDEYGVLRFENSPLYFYCEDGNIYKKYGNDSDKKTVKSNISNSVLSSIGDGLLAVSCADDDCVYLISYAINEKGEMINIKNSLLIDTYAVPIYIKDSKHIAFAKPNSQRELLLNTETGKAEDGEFLNDSNLDNKPAITEQESRKIALNELSKSQYKEFAKKEHSFSAVGVSTLEYKPQYQGDYSNSWVTKDYFNNNPSWIWTVKVGCDKDDLCDMIVYINAADGNVLYVANSSD